MLRWRGERWGPLHGIPMTVKESFNLTFGNPLWKDNIAAGNDFLVDCVLQAGAIAPVHGDGADDDSV
jgi:amidase